MINVKKIIIDSRMRNIEKKCLESLGYKLVELPRSNDVYEEISSHTDIFVSKIGKNVIVEPSIYELVLNECGSKKSDIQIIKGDIKIKHNYPFDVPYNVCIIGSYAIHNFKFTSRSILEILKKEKYNLINVNQGYTNCSIAIIDKNGIIINDNGLDNSLPKKDFEILLVERDLDIKLLMNNGKYSSKKGFIGGCISRIDDKIIVFGDLNRIDRNGKIRNFIKNRRLEIIEFEGLDVIDYGGVLIIE